MLHSDRAKVERVWFLAITCVNVSRLNLRLKQKKKNPLYILGNEDNGYTYTIIPNMAIVNSNLTQKGFKRSCVWVHLMAKIH